MKRVTVVVLLVLLAGTVPGAGLAANDNPAAAVEGALPGGDYFIGPGDVLQVAVWKNEDLSRVVTVLPDGKIALPLVGEMMAANKTVNQLQKELEQKIIKYVPDPTLTVAVNAVNSMLVYVIGRVNAPGRFVVNSNLNVLQALATAGGLNPFADRKEIRILRNQGGKTDVLIFNYNDVSQGKNLEQNIFLKRGDVVVVP